MDGFSTIRTASILSRWFQYFQYFQMFYGYSNNFSDSFKIARKKPLAGKFCASADKALAPVSEKLFGPSDTSRIKERK